MNPKSSGVSDVEEKFGMDGYAVGSREGGGQHHTAFSSDEGSARFSWDTDAKGDYVEGSAHETLEE